MTAQAGERIIYKDQEYFMATEPLEQYLDGLKERPNLVFPSTACWRGYYGTWKIEDKRLFLIKLKCFTEGYSEVGMEFIFPNQEIVFAGWFTGEIRIPQGEMLEYVHMGYESLFEKDLFLKIENGLVIDEWVVDNRIDTN